MSLSAADVAEIMRLVEQSTFDELTLEIDGTKLTLRRGAAVAQSAVGQNAVGQSGAGVGLGQGTAGGTLAAQRTTANNEVAAPSAALAGASQGNTPNSAATRESAGRGSASDPNTHEVQSPLLGTFYRSPKPGAPPFVDVGAVVDEDTTVAIIEVMKLMNTVRAGVRGTVTEVLASDGALVEFEQPLLRVRKAG